MFGAFLGSIIGGIAGLLIGAGLGGMSAGATVIGAAIKGGSALALVLGGTASTGAAIAIGSTQMLIGGVIAIGGIAVGAMEFNVLFSKDPYVKSLDRKLNKEEQEEFQREIEDWKKGPTQAGPFYTLRKGNNGEGGYYYSGLQAGRALPCAFGPACQAAGADREDHYYQYGTVSFG